MLSRAVGEVPAAPPPVVEEAAAGVHLCVVAADDAAPCWQETWLAGRDHWRRVTPVHPTSHAPWGGLVLAPLPRSREALARDLAAVVAESLGRLHPADGDEGGTGSVPVRRAPWRDE